MKSWKTTIAGLVILVCSVLIGLRQPDNFKDPTTLALLTAAIGLLQAKDHDNDGRAT